MLQKNKQRAFSRSSIVTLLYQMFVNENNFFQKVLDTSILIQLVFSGMFFTFLSFSRQFFANSLSNLLHDFWKDCFHRAKFLLAVNRLIYLNQECQRAQLSSLTFLFEYINTHSFLCRITVSGVKIRLVLKKFMKKQRTRGKLMKIIIICENKYSR